MHSDNNRTGLDVDALKRGFLDNLIYARGKGIGRKWPPKINLYFQQLTALRKRPSMGKFSRYGELFEVLTYFESRVVYGGPCWIHRGRPAQRPIG
jgi:hypothetical protein